MWLELEPAETSEPYEAVVRLVTEEGRVAKHLVIKRQFRYSPALLRGVWQALSAAPGQSVQGITVVRVAGSFTNVRRVTAIANTLAWLWDIPVDQTASRQTTPPRLGKTFKRFIKPVYFGQPNISV